MDMGAFWANLMSHITDLGNVELYRTVMESCGQLATEPTCVTYEEVKCPGTVRPAIWCRPQSSSLSHIILYLHGGGFIAGSPQSHRKLAGHLAQRAGTCALLIDYRRAPEHQFPAQIDDVVAAYKWLINEQDYAANQIALCGDSAGGNLAVSSSLKLKQLGLPMPGSIMAFSPWLDMRITGESYKQNNGKDMLASAKILPSVVQMYTGSASLDDPLIDVLRTDLTGLPPIFVATGTAEVLESDASTLSENARLAGIKTELQLAEGMQHIWVALAGNALEADDTLARAAAFLRSSLKGLKGV